jgi:hypothetical protein
MFLTGAYLPFISREFLCPFTHWTSLSGFTQFIRGFQMPSQNFQSFVMFVRMQKLDSSLLLYDFILQAKAAENGCGRR